MELTCYALDQPIKQLSDIHFLAFYQAVDLEPGSDFLFWLWLTQGSSGWFNREAVVD